jgi:hypothetical protein
MHLLALTMKKVAVYGCVMISGVEDQYHAPSSPVPDPSQKNELHPRFMYRNIKKTVYDLMKN